MKKGLFGGALLALGGGGLALRGSALVAAPKEPLTVLTLREYSILQALAKRLIPPLDGFPSVEAVDVAGNADRIIAKLDEGARAELRQLIGLFENALPALLFGGRLSPFTQLSGDEQDAVLREWRDSRLTLRRTGYNALRVLLLSAFYGSPLSWPGMGYAGPPPGFHQPDAPVWKGGGVPRPDGNGVFVEPVAVDPERKP